MAEEKSKGLIDLEFIRNLAAAAMIAREPGIDRKFTVVPQGFQQLSIPALHELPLPDHIRQHLHLTDRESFTRYVKQYKNMFSKIFGTTTPSGANFVAVLDYHGVIPDGPTGSTGSPWTNPRPNRVQHVAQFTPKYSDEFSAWCAINGKPLTQDQFLDHLRRWGYVINSHTDADLVEIVSNLEFTTNGQFSSKVERTTGGRKLIYTEQVEANQTGKQMAMIVPDTIQMESEIFAGGAQFEYSADLLYRVGAGQLKIIVELKRIHKVVKSAIESLMTDITTETGLKPLIGTVQFEVS